MGKDNFTFISMYASGSKNQCVEAFEQEYPIIWERFELVPDSGGAGRTRGGLGTIRRIRFTGDEATLSSIGDREKFPAWGLFGGQSALNQGLVVNPGTDKENNIGVYVTGFPVSKNDFWDFWSGGGGGFEDPLSRAPELVLEDVLDGYVTLDGARRDYGVAIRVIDELSLRYEVEAQETKKLREGMSRERTTGQGLRKSLDAGRFRVDWSMPAARTNP
jgi:N-methylhydantoinase B